MNVLIPLFITFISIQKIIRADTQQWTDYKTKFDKKYTTTVEDQQRMKIYQENADEIARHNELYKQGKVGYELAMNDFGDLTGPEFTKTHLLQQNLYSDSLGVPKLQQTDDPFVITSLPSSLGVAPETKNWVAEGAVTEVKDQGSCSCCWAYVAVGIIEGQMYIHKRKKESLSAQNLVDCVGVKEGRMNGCEIGNTFYALQYIIDNGGIAAEKWYPYEERQSTCRYNVKYRGATITDFKKVQPGNESLLKEVVGLIGSVTCAINIANPFIFYKSGVYDSETCTKAPETLTHAVLIVGYGTESRKDYWLCKNQWGTGWGDNGYIKIGRNSNTCGIATHNFFPVL